MSETTVLEFPENFRWGVATSAYQIEGGIHNDWSRWEAAANKAQADKYKQKGEKIPGWEYLKHEIIEPDTYVNGKSVDHWNRWRNDFQLIKDLNMNAYRFSIEWARVEPRKGKWNEEALDQYVEMIAELQKLGISPMITLWHFTLPVWVEEMGGWENQETELLFARFVEKVVGRCKNTNLWVTLNEPEIYVREAYVTSNWPPNQRNLVKYFTVLSNLIDAHKLASKAIKDANPIALVGIAKNNTYFQPYKNFFANQLVAGFASWWWNRYFLNWTHKELDFIGINYYFHRVINVLWRTRDLDPHSDMGSELAPYGIYHVVMEATRYGLPIFITENGLADAKDDRRQWFIKQSLVNLHRAMEHGAEVLGYYHWSLLDNFEWDKGFWPKFGLHEVNRTTLERRRRPSADFYAGVAATNTLPL